MKFHHLLRNSREPNKQFFHLFRLLTTLVSHHKAIGVLVYAIHPTNAWSTMLPSTEKLPAKNVPSRIQFAYVSSPTECTELSQAAFIYRPVFVMLISHYFPLPSQGLRSYLLLICVVLISIGVCRLWFLRMWLSVVGGQRRIPSMPFLHSFYIFFFGPVCA